MFSFFYIGVSMETRSNQMQPVMIFKIFVSVEFFNVNPLNYLKRPYVLKIEDKRAHIA